MASNILDIPEKLIPNSMDITLASNTKVFESTFNKSTTTAKFAGDRWQVSLNYENLDSEIDDMSAFIFSIGGMSGRVRIPPFHRMGAVAAGLPVVASGEYTGGLLNTEGWLPNRVVLRTGQYFQVGDELKVLTEDCVSDASGNATLTFTPWLRTSPAAGSDIITKRPTGVFRLADDEVTMSLSPMNGALTLSFTEAYFI